jgi:prophage tail gpP-like protein
MTSTSISLPDIDGVSISLSGNGVHTVLSGWQSVRVTMGIERVPPDFSLTYTEQLADGSTSVAVPGQACVVSIGADTVITGYVDQVTETISEGSHQATLTGRGRTEDLVDCAAIWKGAIFTNVTALDVATKLGQPYGITATTPVTDLDLTDFKRFPIFAINLGEPAFTVIDRICKMSGVLAFESPDGTLLLTRVGTVQAASGFEQGTNVQSASYVRSMDQRFSDYTVVYSGNQLFGDTGEAVLATYNYKDSGVPRLRQKYIELLIDSAGSNFSQTQAMWEMNRRAGRSQVVTLTTDSWRDQDGELWTPNTLVDVDLPAIKVPRTQLLIGEVTFMRGLDTGTTAELTLMPPQAFDVEPIPYLPIAGDVVTAAP